MSPDGRVSGTLPTGAQLGLRLLDGTAAAQWAADDHGQAAIDQLAARFPNAVMVHTPVHAS
ncbi:MAG: hypothetical protein ABIQ18_13650 [Umezawaea sp.]